MTEEPYRWLEAIGNRREYIQEQLKGATPVFALTRPEGVLLVGVGQGYSKVFEVYDRHGLAVLGHPVDIEKIRQAAIEAAHLEGFNRSARDVTLRRLISFAMSALLKNAFEQIFAPPIIVESIFVELGDAPEQDVLVRLHFDGKHHYETSGVCVAHADAKREEDAANWLRQNLKPEDSLERAASLCLTAWKALTAGTTFSDVSPPESPALKIEGKVVEAALLDRKLSRIARYRSLQWN